MIRVERQAGWVIHRRPWRESSLLIEMFTPDHGRVGLVARGARATRSAWRGLAEPFRPLEVSWSRRGEMGTVSGLDQVGPACALNGRALFCGLYANELVLRLVGRDDPHPEVYRAYGQLLAGLAAAREAQSLLLRRFELALLTGMGVAPDLEYDAASGEPIRRDRLYHLRPEIGLVGVERAGRAVFRGAAIEALRRGETDDRETARAMRELMRILIDEQLDGRPIAARRLLSGAATLTKQGD